MKSSLHRLIPFLDLILRLPIPKTRLTVSPIPVLGWRLEVRLFTSTVYSVLYSTTLYYLVASELLYDWLFTVNQVVLATSPLRLTTGNFIFKLNICGYSPSFTTAAGPRQSRHSQVRVPRDSSPHFTVSHSRLPQPGGQVPVFISTRNSVARLYPQALGSLVVASYDSHGRHRKHSLYCWHGVFTTSLPSNRRPIVPRVCFCGNVFGESLPSNEYHVTHYYQSCWHAKLTTTTYNLV
jgi:hypothetical protein